MNEPIAVKIDETTWRFEDGDVRCFLLNGSERAQLIDCGMTLKGVRKLAEDLTGLSVELLLTHMDPDHIGALSEFDAFMVHPSEKPDREFIPVSDGDVIDLGERQLEIIHVPGHTAGSVMVLDVSARVLYSGDSVQDGRIFLFGERRNINVFPSSLKRLETYRERFGLIYPFHGTIPLTYGIIPEIIRGTEDVIAGRITGHEASVFGHRIMVYDIGCAKILGDV